MSRPLGRITGCVITRNEEGRIRACLESMSFCDELIVVDAHSTDRTREIAAACGARVMERDWPGYRSQKQFAVDAASHDWILFLDADERVSDQLTAEITSLCSLGSDCAAFRLPFRSIYFGRELRFGDAARETHVRLFDRRTCRFAGHEIHEKVEVAGRIGRLRGAVLHDSYRSLDHQLTKLATYARLMGEAMHAHGRRGSTLKLLLNPVWRFLRGYVLRLGMLDGWRGLAVALADANYVRQKYLHLLVLSRMAGRD
jgi:glycosyltransferase involved in cell wall biosynthesis